MSRPSGKTPFLAEKQAAGDIGDSTVEVVELTPPGRGAVATLRIEGPGTLELLEKLVVLKGPPAIGERPIGRIMLGRFGHEPGEEVVVCRRADEAVEIHSHGGRMAAETIRAELQNAGARVASWQGWTARQHHDPITAAAHVALASARTERTAAILLDQYHGALRRAFDRIDEATRNGQLSVAQEHIETLLARAELGRHLTRPWMVALGGPENAGKSSLLNALLGYSRAIVHHRPGTTRDVLAATTALDGWPVELCDTAGLAVFLETDESCDETDKPVLREESETGATSTLDVDMRRFLRDDHMPTTSVGMAPVDSPGLPSSASDGQSLRQAGIERAARRLAEADLVVLVFDAGRPWSEEYQALVDAHPAAMLVHNKADLPPAAGARPPGLSTSALTGEGVDALASAIAGRLVPAPPHADAAVPFTEEQVEQLVKLRSPPDGTG